MSDHLALDPLPTLQSSPRGASLELQFNGQQKDLMACNAWKEAQQYY